LIGSSKDLENRECCPGLMFFGFWTDFFELLLLAMALQCPKEAAFSRVKDGREWRNLNCIKAKATGVDF